MHVMHGPSCNSSYWTASITWTNSAVAEVVCSVGKPLAGSINATPAPSTPGNGLGSEAGDLGKQFGDAAGPGHHPGQTPQPGAQVSLVRFPLGGGQFGWLRWLATGLGVKVGHGSQQIYVTNARAWARRSFPDGVLGIVPGSSTTTLRGRTSTSATTSWAT